MVGLQEFSQKDKFFTQFMSNVVNNLWYLIVDVDLNILLFPGFCRLHHTTHLEFECLSCQDMLSRVLIQLAQQENFPLDAATEEALSTTKVAIAK